MTQPGTAIKWNPADTAERIEAEFRGTTSPKARSRLLVLIQLRKGDTPSEVAKGMHSSVDFVHSIIALYESDGLAALALGHEGLPRRDEFPTLLRSYRERAVRSRNSLAHDVGVDPSYLTRIEHGDREPPRQHIIEALARALRLTVPERNRLLVSAGFAPLSVMQLGTWDDALQAVADVLNDIHLSPEELEEYRSVIRLISARWRGAAPTPRLSS